MELGPRSWVAFMALAAGKTWPACFWVAFLPHPRHWLLRGAELTQLTYATLTHLLNACIISSPNRCCSTLYLRLRVIGISITESMIWWIEERAAFSAFVLCCFLRLHYLRKIERYQITLFMCYPYHSWLLQHTLRQAGLAFPRQRPNLPCWNHGRLLENGLLSHAELAGSSCFLFFGLAFFHSFLFCCDFHLNFLNISLNTFDKMLCGMAHMSKIFCLGIRLNGLSMVLSVLIFCSQVVVGHA